MREAIGRQYFGGKPTIAALSGLSKPLSPIGVSSIKILLQRIQVSGQPFRVLVSASHSAPQPLPGGRRVSVATFALREHRREVVLSIRMSDFRRMPVPRNSRWEV